MKRFYKVTMIAGGILIGVGGILAVTAKLMGAVPGMISFSRDGNRYVDRFEFQEEHWDAPDDLRDGHGDDWEEHWDTASEYYEFSDIDRLELDLDKGAVEIVPEDGIQAVQVWFSREAAALGARAEKDGRTLELRQTEKRRKEGNEAWILVTVPGDLALSELECEIGAGECRIGGIEADRMEVSVDVGALEVRGARIGELSVENGVGSTAFQGDVARRVSAECGIGEIALELKGEKKDFNYRLESGLGEIALGNSESGGISVSMRQEKIDNRAGKDMDLEVGAGSIEVSFYE